MFHYLERNYDVDSLNLKIYKSVRKNPYFVFNDNAHTRAHARTQVRGQAHAHVIYNFIKNLADKTS